MGRGQELARPFGPEHAAVLDELKDQLLIVFLKRLGGVIDVPVAEVDDTGDDLFAFSLDVKAKTFRFEVRKKP